MSWPGLTLVTDLTLGDLEPQATHPDAPWGQTSWPSARAEAKRLGESYRVIQYTVIAPFGGADASGN